MVYTSGLPKMYAMTSLYGGQPYQKYLGVLLLSRRYSYVLRIVRNTYLYKKTNIKLSCTIVNWRGNS